MSEKEPARQVEMASAEIDRLGGTISSLNLFRAAGMSWSELRHSDLLAFFLSPIESHRLGDKFLKRFLDHVLLEHPEVAVLSPEELASWTLGDTHVYRERDHIDILLLNMRLGLAVIIENKTGSQEHGDQLKRYQESVALHSPRTPRVIGLFLSTRSH